MVVESQGGSVADDRRHVGGCVGLVQPHGPLIELSRTSTIWAVLISDFDRSRALRICIRQPGLLVTTIVGRSRDHRRSLTVSELIGSVRLHEVVDPRRTAAHGVLDLAQIQLRDFLQECSWLDADALGVSEMASVVVGNPGSHGVTLGARATEASSSEISRVRLVSQSASLLKLGVVGEEPGVLLHCRSTASSVDYHKVDFRGLEDVDGLSGEAERLCTCDRRAPTAHRNSPGPWGSRPRSLPRQVRER